jgi:hypothetical protein
MLVRGGVDEARIERIEGYADRAPRNTADPKAAELLAGTRPAETSPARSRPAVARARSRLIRAAPAPGSE